MAFVEPDSGSPKRNSRSSWSKMKQVLEKRRRWEILVLSHQLHFMNNMLPYENHNILVSGIPPRWDPEVLQRHDNFKKHGVSVLFYVKYHC